MTSTTSTKSWLRLGRPRPLNPCATTTWSVSSTERLETIIHLFYHFIQPSISHNNLGQGETNYTGYHFGADQVPDPTMNFSPHFPGVNASQGSFPVWRFHDYWFTHVEQDELHLTVVLKKN